MRLLFLAYIVGMAFFAFATIAKDQIQEVEEAARVKAEQEKAVREDEQQKQIRIQRAAARKRQLEEEQDRQREAERNRRKEDGERKEREREIARKRDIENRCDQLASNEFDRSRNQLFPGVSYDILRLNADLAIARCREAVAESPNNPRFRYQLARALQAQKNPEAKSILTALTHEGYLAAYDNLGWWYFNSREFRTAISYLKAGSQRGDVESMVSMSRFLLEGRFVPKDEREAIRLLAQAEQYGHPTAVQAMEKYREQQRMNAFGAALFATVLGEILRQAQ